MLTRRVNRFYGMENGGKKGYVVQFMEKVFSVIDPIMIHEE
jgi:hypothetical protein